MAKKTEPTTITITHEYNFSKEDAIKLGETEKLVVKTYVVVKDKPEVISNSGEVYVKQSNATKKK